MTALNFSAWSTTSSANVLLSRLCVVESGVLPLDSDDLTWLLSTGRAELELVPGTARPDV